MIRAEKTLGLIAGVPQCAGALAAVVMLAVVMVVVAAVVVVGRSVVVPGD